MPIVLKSLTGLQGARTKMKRGRPLNLDVTQQARLEDVASREASNSLTTPTGHVESLNDGNKSRKKRGRTRTEIIKDKYKQMTIQWNDKEQSVGYNSISFASFLGATIQENVSITTKSWEEKKDDLWTMIKKEESEIPVKRWCVYTRAYTRKNGKPVNVATKKVLDELAAYAKENESAVEAKNIREDPVAKVLGAERRERIKRLGFGATPSKIDVAVATNGRMKKLEKKLETQDFKVHTLEKKKVSRMDDLEKKVECVDKLKDNLKKLSELYLKQTRQNASGSNRSNITKENARCELLNWYNYDTEEVVAEGKIVSIDPKAKVHHMSLDRDCWKVWVENAIGPTVNLYRPTEEAHIMNEVVGSTVAWPKSSIRLLK